MMGNLINDLLDLAKLQKTTFELDESYFNLIDVVTETFQIMTYEAESNNIELLLELDKS